MDPESLASLSNPRGLARSPRALMRAGRWRRVDPIRADPHQITDALSPMEGLRKFHLSFGMLRS